MLSDYYEQHPHLIPFKPQIKAAAERLVAWMLAEETQARLDRFRTDSKLRLHCGEVPTLYMDSGSDTSNAADVEGITLRVIGKEMKSVPQIAEMADYFDKGIEAALTGFHLPKVRKTELDKLNAQHVHEAIAEAAKLAKARLGAEGHAREAGLMGELEAEHLGESAKMTYKLPAKTAHNRHSAMFAHGDNGGGERREVLEQHLRSQAAQLPPGITAEDVIKGLPATLGHTQADEDKLLTDHFAKFGMTYEDWRIVPRHERITAPAANVR